MAFAGEENHDNTVTMFVVPGAQNLCNYMMLDEDLPLHAVRIRDDYNHPGLVLRYSSHQGIELIIPFALLYFRVENLDDPNGRGYAADLVNDPEIHHCVVTAPVDDPIVRAQLTSRDSVFDVVNFPAEVAALVEENIITLSSRTVKMSTHKVPLPIGTINTETTMEDLYKDVRTNNRVPKMKIVSLTTASTSTSTNTSSTTTPSTSCIRFKPYKPSHTIGAFILFTALQLLIFLFRPELYQDAAPGMDKPPTFAIFRLIGIKECGLILMYSAISYRGDRALMKMTVVGRMMVVPYSLWCVFVLGAPWTMLFGIVQDVTFGLWTAATLSMSTHLPARQQRIVGVGIFSRIMRFALLLGGLSGMYCGFYGLSNPQYLLDDQPPFISFLQNAQLSDGIHLGVRSVALIYFLVGAYHVGIGLLGAHPLVFFTCALYHLVVMCAFSIAKAWRKDLAQAYHVPGLHVVFAPIFFVLSILSFSSVLNMHTNSDTRSTITIEGASACASDSKKKN